MLYCRTRREGGLWVHRCGWAGILVPLAFAFGSAGAAAYHEFTIKTVRLLFGHPYSILLVYEYYHTMYTCKVTKHMIHIYFEQYRVTCEYHVLCFVPCCHGTTAPVLITSLNTSRKRRHQFSRTLDVPDALGSTERTV